MPTLKEIKAQQIEAAAKAGEPNPYELKDTVKAVKVAVNRPQTVNTGKTLRTGKLAVLKAKQIEEEPELYGGKATLLGFDMASGADQSASMDINLFEQLQAAMQTDVARIKGVNKLSDKQEIKRHLLPNYLPFVENYVTEEHDYPCDIAVQVMVWLFDIDDIEKALAIGTYLVRTGTNQLPIKFSRDLPTFIIDETYEWAKIQLQAEQTASPYLDDLISTIEQDEWDKSWKLHPLLISKAYAMLAKHKEREEDFKACVSLCERAETANPEGAGVKTMKERAQKILAKQKEQATTE